MHGLKCFDCSNNYQQKLLLVPEDLVCRAANLDQGIQLHRLKHRSHPSSVCLPLSFVAVGIETDAAIEFELMQTPHSALQSNGGKTHKEVPLHFDRTRWSGAAHSRGTRTANRAGNYKSTMWAMAHHELGTRNIGSRLQTASVHRVAQ